VLVVDDGSIDSTTNVVEQFQDDHSNVRLLRHESNRGRGAARHSGQEATHSSLIGFVDADIVVPTDWLERCAGVLSKFDAVSGIALPDGDCAVLWRICEPSLRRRPGSAEITGNNVLFSRHALTRVTFSPHSQLGEDFRLAKQMVRDGLLLTTLGDLVVEHRESKTYVESIVWMWHSGVDATALLFEFRVFRVPDSAWIIWTVGVLTTVIGTSTGIIGVALATSPLVALTLVISLLFVRSRFLARPHPWRFLWAFVISPPLILAYLIGRCAGLLRLVVHPARLTGSSS
jgi:glycosyltransferase involved in cell wall biosynthesis